MMVVQMVFFVSAGVSYSVVERLCYSLAKTKPWERRSVTVREDLETGRSIPKETRITK